MHSTTGWLRRVGAAVGIAVAIGSGAATGTVATADQSAAQQVQQAGRHLKGNVNMYIRDDEVFSDEHCYFNQYPDFVMTEQSGTWSFVMVGTCGGEIRAELDHKYTLVNGFFEVSGELRLYEGGSTSTTDLDGRVPVDVLVIHGGPWVQYVFTTNTEEDEPDLAQVKFTLENLAP